MSRGAIWWRMVLPIRAVTTCLILLLPFQRSCARQGEAGVDSSFKRKRALGKRAWNGQTLEASSSTGQQLRQGGREEGSQLGHRSNRRAAAHAPPCPAPRPKALQLRLTKHLGPCRTFKEQASHFLPISMSLFMTQYFESDKQIFDILQGVLKTSQELCMLSRSLSVY